MPTFIAQTPATEENSVPTIVRISYQSQQPWREISGLDSVRRRRARNHRMQVVRNLVERAGVMVSPKHTVKWEQGRYVFTLSDGKEFSLPNLGYSHNREWREIRTSG